MKRAIQSLRIHIRYCRAGCHREGLRVTALCPTGVALADDVARAFERAQKAHQQHGSCDGCADVN